MCRHNSLYLSASTVGILSEMLGCKHDRVVDVDAYEKLQKMLVTYLNKCTLFLVGELASFDGSLVHRFCVLTFSEFRKSSMNDQMEKVRCHF